MNNKERNYRIAYEALMILAAIALLSFICRLWPIIILALVGITVKSSVESIIKRTTALEE